MKVLVVVDLQTDFTFGALGNAECVGVVEKVAKLISEEAEQYQKKFDSTGKKIPITTATINPNQVSIATKGFFRKQGTASFKDSASSKYSKDSKGNKHGWDDFLLRGGSPYKILGMTKNDETGKYTTVFEDLEQGSVSYIEHLTERIKKYKT